MDLCGICRYKIDDANMCDSCRIYMCIFCTENINSMWEVRSYDSCVLCFNPSFTIFISNFYCKCCDKCVAYEKFSQTEGRCAECVAQKKTLECRANLTHYHAKDMLEARYIPVIAKIIFDYYYEMRRYFPGEF